MLIKLQVRHTQRAIKHVLTERYYAWQDAAAIAKDDPEVDLSGMGPAYTPSEFEDEMLEMEAEAELQSDVKPEQELSVEPEVKPEQKTSPTL